MRYSSGTTSVVSTLMNLTIVAYFSLGDFSETALGQRATSLTAAEVAYNVELVQDQLPATPKIELPDLSQYSREAILAKRPSAYNGTAELASTDGVACLSESFTGKMLPRFQAMQGVNGTRLIKVSGGAVELSQLVDQIDDDTIIRTDGRNTIVRLPILVSAEATLVIDGEQTPTVRLVTETGTLLANSGTMLIIDATVSSWSETVAKPIEFVDANRFRPFLTSFAGSTTYAVGSQFQHLGYSAPSAYGFSITSHPKRHQPESPDVWPTGTLLGNTFNGLYYGFYSYEARDVAIIDNHYLKSIRYGIDPHDRSTRLIVAHNLAEETVERHGIIGSRGIDHSWFFGNVARHNAKSGMMLDRNCTSNYVIGNSVYDNGNGIALYESSHNVLLDNIVAFNRGTGVRVRNCVDVLLQNNTVAGNQGFAITCEARHLADHEKRVARGDTYREIAGISVFANKVAANSDGVIKGARVSYLNVGGIDTNVRPSELQVEMDSGDRQLPAPDDDPLGGDLVGLEASFRQVIDTSGTVMKLRRASPVP